MTVPIAALQWYRLQCYAWYRFSAIVKSFIQSLINNTNIYIYSGDKSTPELLMNGLKANSDIIQTIRNRVEEQKKKKGIYEFTNR